VRNRLTSLLGLPRLYDLDRLDLTVNTTLDGKVQKSVVHILRRLSEPAYVDSVGLKAFRLLEKGDPSKVVYSFTLYETVGGKNLLRVQADNYEQPLNINEGVKLDLGSTAKLRTLVNYLEIVAALHGRHAGKDKAELERIAREAPDALTRWAADWMAAAPDTLRAGRGSLLAILNAAMDRKYSANAREKFFTGGGIHTFVNFDPGRDHVMDVREAIRHSVNLPFIRMMRDIVNYYIAQGPVSRAALLDSGNTPARQEYLARFAQQEGQVFMGRFYRKYRGKNPAEILDLFFPGVRRVPKRLATAYLTLEPKADTAAFRAFMRAQLSDSLYPEKPLDALYRAHFQEKLDFADLAYVAGVHPLELWLVRYLRENPMAHWSQVKEAGRGTIQETYHWLFKTRHRSAQDSRIRSMLESEAFLEIHRAWSRLGYPFGSLVPSYATSIGSSADRPNALAELVGILLNDGVRYPSVLINRLHFAENTPFETVLNRADTTSQRLLPPEVCRVAREALLDIVETGSAVRGRKAFPAPGGGFLTLGGKTGTGDQRFETFGKGGQVLESRVVNRTATFVFFLGDRFFGTLTAHVHGEEAAGYGFTSSLPVALLRLMQPSLMPLIADRPEQGMPRGAVVAEGDPAPRALPVPAGFEAPLGFPGQAVPTPAKGAKAGKSAVPSREAAPALPLPAPGPGDRTAEPAKDKVVPAGPAPRILPPAEGM
jgi:membrane peptidoglycan carboxypeptidase